MSNESEQAALEAEAAEDFARERAAANPGKKTERAAARKIAQDAASVARAFLAEPAPKLPEARADVADAPVPTVTARCGCGVELGHMVYGVHTDGRWFCPECFLRQARSYDMHPVARAVECPTCHRNSVDFTGRNQCAVCRARGARPVRLH